MSSSIYIFVDESGRASTDDVYTVAACWSVSQNEDPEQILKPLRSNVQKFLTECVDNAPDNISELKGSKLSKVLSETTEAIDENMWNDNSVEDSHNYWGTSIPIRFTLRSFENRLLRKTLSSNISEVEMSDAVKTVALNSVLTPIHSSELSLSHSDEVYIYADASPWDRPTARYEEGLSDIGFQPTVTLDTRDSQNTPGIQFADIAAYSLRRQFTQDDSGRAVSRLENWSL